MGASSKVTEGMSEALEVTETRAISEERAWGTETANRAEPVSEEEAEQPASSATVSANIHGMNALFMNPPRDLKTRQWSRKEGGLAIRPDGLCAVSY
ncbi:hypothetical protein D187_004068 [Cystobacter fuscus DSM 2262]|uniref:Uncharacterized protein n=1 Tax=Cystobacter fuscus (strain ATCC 25194 / DSM 2262 / NBRC 100088 / M29) TaxID=1242864 RepID=S9P7V8_CYSF2|nr:hypothetical protein D187_004068 [Cystobacter fuscus DSM 2262]